MKAIFNAAVYLVLARDAEGQLYSVHGNLGDGLYATQIREQDMRGVTQFETVMEHGMGAREFKFLHRALATDSPIRVVTTGQPLVLDKKTIFYREIHLESRMMDMVPHHKVVPKKTPQFYAIVGATCHYRTTTITLVGESKGNDLGCESFVHQIYREAAQHGWKIEHHTLTGTRRTKALGVECTVQFTFEIGTQISKVRRHMIETFRAGTAHQLTSA